MEGEEGRKENVKKLMKIKMYMYLRLPCPSCFQLHIGN